MSNSDHDSESPKGKYLALLSLTSLGVVFGDIGTSPLYAIRECFNGEHALPLTEGNILGVLSLIFWALLLIIALKYMMIVLKADHDKEGGILALMSLVNQQSQGSNRILHNLIVWCGLFGAALLYGDGAITPAISVMSAIEGLKIATSAIEPYILPITLAILIFLFSFQKYGTEKIGKLFGPIMLIWFGSLAILGTTFVFKAPQILAAISPLHAIQFLLLNHWHGFLILGIIFLVVTGGEAVYADMGHFGKKPIRIVWFSIVMPALLLNYFGQGALLLSSPETVTNPFFYMLPSILLYPMVILATCATIIASQAVISGVFSLTRQAVMLGYLPRVQILHTSSKEVGQIYIPVFNWLMLFATLSLVVFFKSSSSLAAAYGIAVSATMVITTFLIFILSKRKWKVPLFLSVPIFIFFFLIDSSFLISNLTKIIQGGWFPIALGLIIYMLMATWHKGRRILRVRLRAHHKPLKDYMQELDLSQYNKIDGTAIYMSSDLTYTPPAFIQNLKHNKILHEHTLFINIEISEHPYIPNRNRISVEPISDNILMVKGFYGYMQTPDIYNILDCLEPTLNFKLNRKEISFFLSHEFMVATSRPGMAIWREKLFAFMSRNELKATEQFGIPRNLVVELGLQIEL